MPSFSHLNGESSIPEDLGSPAAESVPSETMGHVQPESPEQSTANEEMVYSEESKSSTSPGKLVSELFFSPCKRLSELSKQRLNYSLCLQYHFTVLYSSNVF